jgi:EAL domain-containing protein (putative c-di-GMP-specific phosphodiesterase class I)
MKRGKMTTDAKESQQLLSAKERLARLEQQVDALAKWCENNTELLKGFTQALLAHKASIEWLAKSAAASPVETEGLGQEINPNKAPRSQDELVDLVVRLSQLGVEQARAVTVLSARLDQLDTKKAMPKSKIN